MVDLNFQRAHDIQHVELVSGSSHCLTWFRDAMRYVFVSFRFHPHSAVERARQLRQLRDRLRDLCGGSIGSARIVLGGDRNFVSSADQKQSSATSRWHPGNDVLPARRALLGKISGCEQCPGSVRLVRNMYWSAWTWQRIMLTLLAGWRIHVHVQSLVMCRIQQRQITYRSTSTQFLGRD